MLPDDMGETRGAIASDNLAIRDRFVAEIPCFTSVEIGKNAGHKAENLYATAARWKKSGAVFSVSHRGAEVFPAFQFREGQPHPAIKKTLAALQRALWFVSTNGWLGDKAPMDLLDDTGEVVAAAARRRSGRVTPTLPRPKSPFLRPKIKAAKAGALLRPIRNGDACNCQNPAVSAKKHPSGSASCQLFRSRPQGLGRAARTDLIETPKST